MDHRLAVDGAVRTAASGLYVRLCAVAGSASSVCHHRGSATSPPRCLAGSSRVHTVTYDVRRVRLN